MKHCKRCNTDKPVTEFNNDSTRPDGRYPTCKPCYNLLHNVARAKEKQECFANYGGKCVCCAETEIHFLSIDHINNDGAAHRRENNIGTGRGTYDWLRRNGYPEGYQVLCHNCNLGKHLNKGICPHQQAA